MAAPVLANRSAAFVAKWGTNDAGYNAVGAPMAFLTIAAALADLAANYPTASATAPQVVSIEPGIYATPAFALPPFTYIVGNPDGPTDPTSGVIVSLSGNVTLSTGWQTNQTAFGGLIGLTFRQTTSQNIDLTMPTPAAGNPARTVTLQAVRTDCDNVIFQATSTADVLNMLGCAQDGTSADAITITGGTILIDNLSSAAIVTLTATTIALTGQAYGIFITSAAGGLVCSTTGAANCTVRLGACDNRALTLGESAAGQISVSADAVSIPLVASITFTGTAANADLIRTTDSNAISGTGGNSYAAATNNAGTTTITPTASNYFYALTVTGAATTRAIVVAISGTAALGDLVQVVADFSGAAAGAVVNFRNATAGGTILSTFTTDGVTNSGRLWFVYTGAAWIQFGQPLFL